MLLYEIINGLTPDYMYDMIQPYIENIHDYNLRQQISGDNSRLPFCNTVSYSKKFHPLYVTTLEWSACLNKVQSFS